MTYRKGLMYGFIAGLSLIVVRLGYVDVSEQAMQTAQALGTGFLAVAFLVIAIRHLKQSSVFSPKIDGFFIGFSFASSLVSFLTYGVSFP